MKLYGPSTRIEFKAMEAVFKLRAKFGNDVRLPEQDELNVNDANSPQPTQKRIIRYIRGHYSEDELREIFENDFYERYVMSISYFENNNEITLGDIKGREEKVVKETEPVISPGWWMKY